MPFCRGLLTWLPPDALRFHHRISTWSGWPFRGLPLSLWGTFSWLTLCKVVFIVAITYARRVSELEILLCKEPFLMLHKDRVGSSCHLNQHVVLPYFFTDFKSPKEVYLLYLDFVSTVWVYLSAMHSLAQSHCLFVLVIAKDFSFIISPVLSG